MALNAALLRTRLDQGSWQRLHCVLIVTLASASAFLVSLGLLSLHVRWMAWRYGIASLAGYGVFLLMIRAWVRWKCSRLDGGSGGGPVSRAREDSSFGVGDLFDGDISLPTRAGGRAAKVAADAFRGGQSGGGGASMTFDAPSQGPPASLGKLGEGGGGKGGGLSLDLDGDDLFWLIVALAATFAGVAAMTYVIWVAPSFLGEAAVHAAVAGKVYHGMQGRDSSHWTSDQFKRTIVPAAVIILSAIVAGYAFHRIAPEAQSIGGVWHHMAAR